jgi:hypothetical protein
LSVVPEGFPVPAINGVMQVAVPGGGSWTAGGAWLSLTTQTLAGLSALDHDAAATLLVSGRYESDEGEAIDVADRAGRYVERPSGSQLTFIRADDVLVTVQGIGLSREQLLQVANGLVPDQFVPGLAPPVAPPPNSPSGDPGAIAVTGRPLRRRRKMLLAPTRWGRRLGGGVGPSMDGFDDLSVAEAEMLRDYWRRIARFEHASITAFKELAMRLRSVDAPVDLIERAGHAARAATLAERFAGRTLRFGHLVAKPQLLGRQDELVRLAVEALRDGALNERYAAWQAAAQAATATDAQVIETLTVVAADEAEHAALSCDVLAWCVSTGGSAVRTAVLASMTTLPGTIVVPPLNGPVAERFGAADPDEDRTFYRALRSMVIEDATAMVALAENEIERVP